TRTPTRGVVARWEFSLARLPSAYNEPIERVPAAACVVSQLVSLHPAGTLSSIHTVSPDGNVGAATLGVMQALPDLPTWSNQTLPPKTSKPMRSIARSSMRSTLAGTSNRTHWPLAGKSPIRLTERPDEHTSALQSRENLVS